MTAVHDLIAPTGGHDSATGSIKEYESVRSTKALSIRADWLRTDVEMLHAEVRTLHEEARTLDLTDRAYERATNGDVPSLLEELAFTRGMSWSDIAAAANVSISAVRKWRKGGTATPESRNRLGHIAALLDLLEEKGVAEPAQWLEMKLPLPEGYNLRPLDLYVRNHADSLIELAEHRQDASQVLDRILPEWREARSDFVVVRDVDGHRTIRPRVK